MSFRKRILAVTLSTFAFLLTGVAVLVVVAWIGVAPPNLPSEAIPLYLVVQCGIPIAMAIMLWRFLNRRWGKSQEGPVRRGQTLAARVLVAAYVMTWAFGAPAAQSHQAAWAVGEYKRLKASGSPLVWDSHPYIQSYAAVPVAPGLLLTYHEYQLDGLYGFGGFDLYLWYGVGVKSLAHLPLWLS